MPGRFSTQSRRQCEAHTRQQGIKTSGISMVKGSALCHTHR